ncbi:STAS domain-containing protein [Amycolatopsis sp. FDAARGOS 1241]|nr:STAS domain-containing protein [Amycolatopsis sp. FDAARGOS 1241]QRP48238.1 STAS domain-containing protein [Amycolatopsis sp. FDAARGOS 1241]
MVIVARGEFDAITSPALREAVHGVLAEAPPVLVMDLTGTVFFSSVAIGVLMDAVLTAGERTCVRVVAARPIRRTLQMLGLDPQFDYFDTTQEALTAPA